MTQILIIMGLGYITILVGIFYLKVNTDHIQFQPTTTM